MKASSVNTVSVALACNTTLSRRLRYNRLLHSPSLVAIWLWMAPNSGMVLHDNVIKGNIFRVNGPFWGGSISHRWIPLTKTNDGELWCFRWSVPEANSWDAGDLRRHRAHYNVIVMLLLHVLLVQVYIGDLPYDCSISIALAMEILQSYAKPSILGIPILHRILSNLHCIKKPMRPLKISTVFLKANRSPLAQYKQQALSDVQGDRERVYRPARLCGSNRHFVSVSGNLFRDAAWAQQRDPVGLLFNTSGPGPNGRHFADDIFKFIAILVLNFHWRLFVSMDQLASIDLFSDLAPKERQAIARINDALMTR